MTDNTIDITNKLPPVEVRKPWRHKLPDCYVKHIDELVALHRKVREIGSRLKKLKEDIESDRTHSEAECIRAAIVLLQCAEERIYYTIPTEENMPLESLREFWGK
jgi:hypothetical protein